VSDRTTAIDSRVRTGNNRTGNLYDATTSDPLWDLPAARAPIDETRAPPRPRGVCADRSARAAAPRP
jgi:hypothetical protein